MLRVKAIVNMIRSILVILVSQKGKKDIYFLFCNILGL